VPNLADDTPQTPWIGLAPHHAALLIASAITPETADRLGVTSVMAVEELPEEFAYYGAEAVPAILFRLPTFGGETRLQLRPDRPIVDREGHEAKYVFPAGSRSALMVLRWDDKAGRVLIVEGTKQALAAASWAPADVNVVGMAGVYGWMVEGAPIPDLQHLDGRDVVICLDGDAATNLDVYTGGAKLAEAALADGARSADFLRLPAGKKAGLDDVLAGRDEANREGYLARLMEKPFSKPADRRPQPKPAKVTNLNDYREAPAAGATPEPDEVPLAQPGAEYFDRVDGLLAVKLLRAVDEMGPTATDDTGQLYRFRDGHWQLGGDREVRGRVWRLLGDRYRPSHYGVVLDGLTAREPLISEERFDPNVLNLPNGLLEWRTGQLYAHSPEHPSTARIPVPWNPEAHCPATLAWLAQVLGPDSIEFAEEVVGLCLYDGAPVHKAIALYGAGRNGKGTFLRLVTALLGADNVSTVTPQRLDENRFASSSLYGKLANLAGDVDPKTFQVTETFKQVTGGDRITAERKNQHAFEFTNRATMIASFNRLPKTADTTEGFFSRWLVVPFTGDFRGANADPAVEIALHAPEELQGLLVRATAGLRRLEARRWVFDPPKAVLEATQDYRDSADPVRMFLASLDGWNPEGGWVKGTDLRMRYSRWAAENGHMDQSAETLMAKLEDLGKEVPGFRVQRVGRKGVRGLRWELTPQQGQEADQGSEILLPTNPGLTRGNEPRVAKVAGNTTDPYAGVAGQYENRATFATSATPTPPGPHPTPDPVTTSPKPPEAVSEIPTTFGPVQVDRQGNLHLLDLASAGRFLAEIITATGELGVDVEHNGYSVAHRLFELKTIQIGDEHRAVVFDNRDPRQRQVAVLALKAAIRLYAFSATADLVPIERTGLVTAAELWDKTHDVMVAAKLADPASTDDVGDAGLKQLAAGVLGEESVAPAAEQGRKPLFKGKRTNVDDTTPIERNGWAQVDPSDPAMLVYGASDVLDTMAVRRRIPWPEPARWERERSFQRTCSRVTHQGIRLDPDRVAAKHAEYTQGRAEAMAAVKEFGIENPGSHPQLAARFGELGASLPLTKKGQLSTAKDALLPLLREQSPAGELARRLTTFRHFDHQLSGFLTPWQRAVLDGDGRIRPTVYTISADTGRTSSARPNIQQVPKRGGFRPCILADPGHLLISADFSSVEIRVAAAVSGDLNVQQMLLEDVDLHWQVARMVWGPEATEEQRGKAKGIVFGRWYGGGIETLAKQSGVTQTEVQTAIEMLDVIAPQLKSYTDWLKEQVRAGLRTWETEHRTIHLDAQHPHKALNYVVQGTARELLVDALAAWEATPWGGGLLWPVHDEVVAQVPEHQAEEATAALVACMTTTLLGVAIVAKASQPLPYWEG
jgi:P4 family phage/plasmid primase-like protien